MRNIFISIIILIFGLTQANAQSLKELMSDKSKNYKDIVNEIKKDRKYLDNSTDKELKRYDRWRWFWDTRVDSSGSFGKILDILSHRFSLAARRYSNALPIKSNFYFFLRKYKTESK